MFKTLSTLSKVLIGTTAALAAATTVFAMKDKKAAKAAEECTCDECPCAEAEASEAEAEEE